MDGGRLIDCSLSVDLDESTDFRIRVRSLVLVLLSTRWFSSLNGTVSRLSTVSVLFDSVLLDSSKLLVRLLVILLVRLLGSSDSIALNFRSLSFNFFNFFISWLISIDFKSRWIRRSSFELYFFVSSLTCLDAIFGARWTGAWIFGIFFLDFLADIFFFDFLPESIGRLVFSFELVISSFFLGSDCAFLLFFAYINKNSISSSLFQKINFFLPFLKYLILFCQMGPMHLKTALEFSLEMFQKKKRTFRYEIRKCLLRNIFF